MTEFIVTESVYILRLVLACICGGIIGYERTNRGKGAGLRTHTIVALASALMMIVSKYGFTDLAQAGAKTADGARIAAQVVSGVGFLGAGMIYFNRNSVRGLTTAAGIWATSGVGLAIGAGMYVMGIASALLIMGTQILLHKRLRFIHRPDEDTLTIVVDASRESVEYITNVLGEYNITICGISCRKIDASELELELNVNIPPELNFNDIILMFYENKLIHSITL